MTDTGRDTDDVAETLKRRRSTSKQSRTKQNSPAPDSTPDEDSAPSETTTETATPDAPGSGTTGSGGGGVSHRSLGGPSVLSGSFVTEGISIDSSGDYVTADAPGYLSWYERGTKQPTVVLGWCTGQRIRRDYYEQHGGSSAARRAADAVPMNEPGAGLRVP